MTNLADRNFWTDRNVFITGATGLLGSWLSQFLLESGANLVGLIRDRVPRSQLMQSGHIDRMTIVSGEVEDYLLVERAINEYEIQTVFHLAAQTIVGIANESPLSTFESNIRGTWHVLEACRRNSRVEQLVTASSDKAYGEHESLPYSEDAPLIGSHAYDVSKSCADLLAQAFAKSYDLPVCVTRFGNLFGPGDLNFNRLIPGTIRSALRNQPPIIRSDGTFSRDYIYVEDAALAYLLLAEKMCNDPSIKGEPFNFSYQSPMTASQVVDKVLAQMDRKDLTPQVLSTATNEIPHQYLDSAKAQNVLGWQPKYDFDDGLKRTIKWYEEQILEQGGR